MQGFDLPFQPIPQRLYTPADLFQGIDLERPASWAETLDFKIYRHSVIEAGAKPRNPYMGMMQALHDSAIMEATAVLVEGRKITAIIGDHAMRRDAAAYRDAARLARRLSRRGILVCTGGGPGAMEAGHLGAALANSADEDLEAALARLGTQPEMPDLGKVVGADGEVDAALVKEAWAWSKPAFELAASLKTPGESLAIPTWHYGHEPPSPFATHIAKYFQNSIREDGMLAIAGNGIICLEGRAGTIQEIFQDSAQNYYESFGRFSPMVLVGVTYWTETYPVVGVLKRLFADRYEKYVLVTDQVDEAADFIEQYA